MSCADPGILVSGGPCQSDRNKALTTFFFVVLSLFYRSQKVNFKGIYHFSRFKRWSNIFQGGGGVPTFSRGGGGGVQLHIPYRNTYNVWFSRGGGGGPDPLSPLWIRTCMKLPFCHTNGCDAHGRYDETFAGEDGYYCLSLDLCCWLFSTRSCLFKGRNSNFRSPKQRWKNVNIAYFILSFSFLFYFSSLLYFLRFTIANKMRCMYNISNISIS